MAFSTGFGLTCMCFIMLLFLPGQGHGQCPKTEPQNVGKIEPDCCTETSSATINEAVDACYVQEEDGTRCKIHAYIFVSESKNTYCVNPNAWWLQTRLEKLKKKGITCELLVK